MSPINKRLIAAYTLVAALFGVTTAQAFGRNPFALVPQMVRGALYVWGSDEVVTNTDLNANFSELNTTKVGGGVTATNSDIASNASIAHSKLATPALVPKAWATLNANCTGSTAAGTACTVSDSSRVTSITTNGASGQFRLNLAYTPSDVNFAVLVTSHTATSVCMATTRATAAPHAIVTCFDYTGAALDTNQFSVLVMDS